VSDAPAPTFRPGDQVFLTYARRIVRIDELIGANKARVHWMTGGRKPPGRRYWTVAPQQREKVVRLSSLQSLTDF
jgi:hypothetical protein